MLQPPHLTVLLVGGVTVADGQTGHEGTTAWGSDAPDGVVLVLLDLHLCSRAVESVALSQRGPGQSFE
ncbi:hypothetical protein [Streptomyces sp. NPDC000405]|uniref:hypothetical protein n=1 Tax=Streptomyces sp. NPDC000405 TaxID=3161033 RepID=UPI00398D56EE